MPDFLNKQSKNSDKIKKVGRSVKWHHIVAGLLIYALIAGGLIWHATQPSQPATHAATSPDPCNTGAHCYTSLEIYVNVVNGGPAPSQEIALTSSPYSIGDCNSSAGQPFYVGGSIQEEICYAYQFGQPPNNPVYLALYNSTSIPAGYTFDGFARVSDDTPGASTNTCSNGSCSFDYAESSTDTAVRVSLNLTYTGGSSGGSGSCTPAPSAPTLSASPGQTSVALSWTTSVPKCSGDSIEYSIFKNGAVLTQINNTNNYTVGGLSCGTGYSFQLYATEEASGTNASTASNTVPTTTTACTQSGGGSSGGSGGGSSGGSSGGSTPSGGGGSGSSSNGSSLPPSGSGSSSHSSNTSGLSSLGAAAASKTGSTTTLLSPQGNQTTSTPPNTPTGFTASAAANSVTVNLSWNPPTTGSAVSEYEIDRSTDNGATWQTLSNNIQNTFFSDLTANFSTNYLYRLVAKNASGNSGYAYANIGTSAFKANAGPNQSTTLKSQDGVATVFIPQGALTQDAACALAINPILDSPNVKGYVPVAGPYTVTCKTQAGTIIQSYAKPLNITVNTANSIFNKYKNLAYYGEQSTSQTWNALLPSTNSTSHQANFQLTNGYSFIVMGQPTHAPWWVTFLIILLILGVIGGGIVLLMRTLSARKQEEAYDVSYRKEWGL